MVTNPHRCSSAGQSGRCFLLGRAGPGSGRVMRSSRTALRSVSCVASRAIDDASRRKDSQCPSLWPSRNSSSSFSLRNLSSLRWAGLLAPCSSHSSSLSAPISTDKPTQLSYHSLLPSVNPRFRTSGQMVAALTVLLSSVTARASGTGASAHGPRAHQHGVRSPASGRSTYPCSGCSASGGARACLSPR